MSLEGFEIVVDLVQREARSVVGALVNQKALAARLCFTHPRVLRQQPSDILGRLWCRPVVGYDGDHAASIHPSPHAPKRWPVPSDRRQPAVSVPMSGKAATWTRRRGASG